MPGTVSKELLRDREGFAATLAQTFGLAEIVRLLNEMGLRHTDLALALGVHPRTIRAWLDESDPRDGQRQRDQIQSLKATVLFLLRRGVLTPWQLAHWLAEPNEALDFRRPLAIIGEGDISENLGALIRAGSPFLRPEAEEFVSPHPSVAAGAADRERPDVEEAGKGEAERREAGGGEAAEDAGETTVVPKSL